MLLCDAIWAVEGMDKECEEYVTVLNELLEGYQMTEEELAEEYGESTITGYTTTYAVLARILSYAEVKAPEE